MRNYLLEGELKTLATLQHKEQDKLLALSNVVGVGLGNKQKKGVDTGETCLTVFVEQKLDKEFLNDGDVIPATLGKYKTDVIEVGTIFAQSDMTNRERMRPAPAMGGCSVGHVNITAGTIGTTVIDRGVMVPRQYYILSNNHILANSNAAAIGDPILQPGPFDGGVNPADRIARLSRFVPIVFSTTANNLVDAAVAEVDFDECSSEIYGIGYVTGVANVQLNSILQKSGRTTGYTRGQVLAINATVNVNYGGSGTARFVNQIITTNMSAGGDSGSLVLDMRDQAVGLLFAGSQVITILNPISTVLGALNIQFLGT